MQAFKYKAIGNDGKKVTGVIEAYDEYEAVAKVKSSCSYVEKIEPVKEQSEFLRKLSEPVSINEKQLSLTARQFSILLRSGLPTERTVATIAAQNSDKYLKRILTEVAEDVAAGYSLASSLETRGEKLPATFIETVRSGEESGSLDKSFERLADYYDKTSKLKGKVKGAMIYPAFLIFLTIVVLIVVVNVAVPTISEVIVSNGNEIPGVTKALLGIYDFFKNYWALIAIIIIGAIVAFMAWRRTEQGHITSSRWALKLPVLGKLNLMSAASEFAATMTTLLSSGLPIPRALNITGRVMSNYATGSEVSKCSVGVEEGQRLGDVLRKSGCLPELLTEMTGVGEEAGTLEDTLTTIGSYYDNEVETGSAKALAMLEPIITIVMGVMIGFIVIALYLPMFTMYNGM